MAPKIAKTIPGPSFFLKFDNEALKMIWRRHCIPYEPRDIDSVHQQIVPSKPLDSKIGSDQPATTNLTNRALMPASSEGPTSLGNSSCRNTEFYLPH
jgi:hypothetical protein